MTDWMLFWFAVMVAVPSFAFGGLIGTMLLHRFVMREAAKHKTEQAILRLQEKTRREQAKRNDPDWWKAEWESEP